ncbi:sensor domain-containing protein [Halorarum halobium]|uniref:sensor domain-containing protein n=1 Tax=Halorarum halobium TaxID=3075121 RepID=UPI0028AC418A|nr:sensor domain-containing protein [Halobaculum sp. XH14]
MTTTATLRDALGSFLGAPFDPRTYRNLAYLVLAVPIGFAAFLVLSVCVSLTLGLSVTLLGPVALVATLAIAVALAWGDVTLTSGLLGRQLSPTFPDTDGDAVTVLKRLVVGRQTWASVTYLCWRALLGFVALMLLTVGLSTALGLLAAPLAYGDHLAITYRLGRYPIDTLPRATGAAAVGLLALFVTLGLSNVIARVSGDVADALLGADSLATGDSPA